MLERLATRARSQPDGIGPIQQSEIVDTFREICGYLPDDRGIVSGMSYFIREHFCWVQPQ
jgi:hypothetical protein